MPQNPSEIQRFACTRVISDRLLSKTIKDISVEGKPQYGEAPKLFSGHFHRVRLLATNWPAEFAQMLDGADSRTAFILAPGVFAGNVAELTTERRLAGGGTGYTRSKRNFNWVPGEPALFGLDLDRGQAPHALWDKIAATGPYSFLKHHFPAAFDGVAVVSRASTSSHIQNTKNGGYTGDRGRHLFFLSLAQEGLREAIERISDHLILRGFGHVFVTAAGETLIRSPVDVSASCDASHLWFEGPAHFENEAFRYSVDQRRARYQLGALFNPNDVPGFTPVECEQLEAVKLALTESAKERAEAARALHFAKLGPRAVPLLRATKGSDVAPDKWRYRLTGVDTIILDDGSAVSVAEILHNRRVYIGQTCHDPIEPGERNKGVIYAFGNGNVAIHSRLHGGQEFDLTLTADDIDRIIGGAK